MIRFLKRMFFKVKNFVFTAPKKQNFPPLPGQPKPESPLDPNAAKKTDHKVM